LLQLEPRPDFEANSFSFLMVAIQLLVECVPFFFAHYFITQTDGRPSISKSKKAVIWLCGFLVYPFISLIAVNNVSLYASWSLLRVEACLIMTVASVGVLVLKRPSLSARAQSGRWLRRIWSLDGALVLIILGWALMMAVMFLNVTDPMRNQPLPLKVDFSLVGQEFGRFFSYFLQFALLGLCAAFIFWVNRYVLIRMLLAEHGVFLFLCGALIAIMLLTPIFANVILALPINVPEQTLLPSEDHNPFAPINYQVVFWLLLFSTPVILAFERQQQGKVLAQVTNERTQTELQLLQQQINPHFLFNTLNNLYALTLVKSDQAPDMVLQLSELLRYTVYEGQKPLVTLSQEVDYVRNYIALQALRFGNELNLETHYPDELTRWQLPPLLLIILVENAFKHGVEKCDSASRLTINLDIRESQLMMKCTNSLPQSKSDASKGVGLKNLRRRLDLLQQDKASFTCGETADNQWHAELKLELTRC